SCGRVARLQEGVDDLEALDGSDLLLPLAARDLRVEQLGLGLEIERLEATLDRLSAHVGLEVQTEAVLQLVEDRVLGLEVADLEVAEDRKSTRLNSSHVKI